MQPLLQTSQATNVVLEMLTLLLRESYIIGDSHSNLVLESPEEGCALEVGCALEAGCALEEDIHLL